MIKQEAKLKFWPRLLFSLIPLCLGASGIQKNIFNVNWVFLFVILSGILYRKLDSSIELHEDTLNLRGLFFFWALRKRPLEKIKYINAFSNTGAYFFRIGFDASIIRSTFWHGTDNLCVLSPVFFDNTEAILRDIIKSFSNVKVDSSALDLLDGKKKMPKHISSLLFGSLSLFFIIGIILMLKDKF